MNNKKLKSVIFFLLMISLVFLSGCPGNEPQPKPETQQKIKIGVSLASMDFDGNQIIKKFMQDRSKKENIQLTWLDAKMDPSQQEKDVDKLIQQKVQTIILQTVDPREGAKLVDKIVQAKIKVIGLETLPYNAPLDGYVAADHTRVGELQGKFILNQINTPAQNTQEQSQGQQESQNSQQQNQPIIKSNVKVLILKGDPMDPVAKIIGDSAQGVLEQSQNVEKITVQEHPEGDPELAQMTVMNTLQEGSIDAIIATDDRLAEAAIKALKAENKANTVLTIGVGADQKTSQALIKGDHDAEIDIMPEQLANFTLDAALDLAQKGAWNNDTIIQNGNFDIPAKIIPVRLIDKAQSHLLLARWGDLNKEEEETQEEQSGQPGQGQEQEQQASSEENSSEGGSDNESGQGGQGKKTKVRIVTQDGKVMEVEVDGEIKKIEQGASSEEQGQGDEQGQEGEQQGSEGGEESEQ